MQMPGSGHCTDGLPGAGTLHAALGLSPPAHGGLRAKGVARVPVMPGVVPLLTARDIPGAGECGALVHDNPVPRRRGTGHAAPRRPAGVRSGPGHFAPSVSKKVWHRRSTPCTRCGCSVRRLPLAGPTRTKRPPARLGCSHAGSTAARLRALAGSRRWRGWRRRAAARAGYRTGHVRVELGIFIRATAGNGSGSSTGGSAPFAVSEAMTDFSSPIEWAGISALTVGGNPVAFSVSSASGINWAQPFAPFARVSEPGAGPLSAAGLLVVGAVCVRAHGAARAERRPERARPRACRRRYRRRRACTSCSGALSRPQLCPVDPALEAVVL